MHCNTLVYKKIYKFETTGVVIIKDWIQDVSLVSEYDVQVVGHSGFVLRFNNVTHEDGVAGVGDDENEERAVHVQTWRHTAKLSSVARCCCGLSPFFVNLKKEKDVV